MAVSWKNHLDRSSHIDFFNERDWEAIGKYWGDLIRTHQFPEIINGDEEFGLTKLAPYAFDQCLQAKKNDPKEKRKSFAFVIGYDGNRYCGYQQQKGTDMTTVEDDLDKAFNRKLVASGRTDKSVSAISQVVTFSTYDDIALEDIVDQVKSSEPFQSHRLTLLDFARVPRKFHPIFCATWRRYVYLFPLNHGDHGTECVDVDCAFINESFSKIVKKTLPFNGFAHRDDRANGDGLQDYCYMYRIRAEVIDMHIENIESKKALCIELVGTRFLRRMVRILSATVIRESVLPGTERDVDILYKICVSRDRNYAALALPGIGLALCGVGFQLDGSALDLPEIEPEDQAVIDSCVTVVNEVEEFDEEDGADGPKKRKSTSQSRRERYQKNKKDRKSNSTIPFKDSALMTPKDDTATISRFLNLIPSNCYEYIQDVPFQEELLNYNPELLYYPERLFHFCSGDLLLPQSFAQVDTTIWDAEIILAHFMEKLHQLNVFNLTETGARPSLIEIGAGTALASLVAYRTGAFECIGIQDLPEVVSRSFPLIQDKIQEVGKNILLPATIVPIGCWWGNDAILTIQREMTRTFVDWIIMADVLYHTEDFPKLTAMIIGALRKNGHVIMVFEQRRKDLNEILCELQEFFISCRVYHYSITPHVRDYDAIAINRNIYICWFQNHKASEKKL